MKIYIRELRATEDTCMECRPNDTIKTIKSGYKYIKAKTKPEYFSLFCNGKHLENDKTLQEENIQDGAIIFLIPLAISNEDEQIGIGDLQMEGQIIVDAKQEKENLEDELKTIKWRLQINPSDINLHQTNKSLIKRIDELLVKSQRSRISMCNASMENLTSNLADTQKDITYYDGNKNSYMKTLKKFKKEINQKEECLISNLKELKDFQDGRLEDDELLQDRKYNYSTAYLRWVNRGSNYRTKRTEVNDLLYMRSNFLPNGWYYQR